MIAPLRPASRIGVGGPRR